MPIPLSDCVFILDGEKHQGVRAFAQHLLDKDVRITPEQAEIDANRAKEFGFENVHEAIGSVNKRLGLKPTTPKVEESVSSVENKNDVKRVVNVEDLPNDLQAFIYEATEEKTGKPQLEDKYNVYDVKVSDLPTVNEKDLDTERGKKYATENFGDNQKHPIVLIDGKLEDGFHRLYAAQQRGDKNIEAIIINTKSNETKPQESVSSVENDDVVKGVKPVYHGTFANFEEFDPEKLGSNTKAGSAKEGFFFASNKKVAESYATDNIAKGKGLEKYAENATEQLKQLTGDDQFEASYKIVQRMFHPKEDFFVRDDGRRVDLYDAKTEKKVQKLLDKINANDDFINTMSDDYFAPEGKLARSGKVKETYLDIKNPFIKDYNGSSFRDEKYSEVIKKAKADGHDAVIFKNTYDGYDKTIGNEPTDIYVVFDKSQIKSKPNETKPQEEKPKGKQPYTRMQDIPDSDLTKASTERRKEAFDKNVDDIAKKWIDKLSAKLPEGTQKSGVGLPEIINKAADIIKKAYHAKEDLKQAVNDAIDYIKSKWDKAWGPLDEREIAEDLYNSGAFTIDEEIEMRFGLTPQEVLDIWNSADAGKNNPDLLDFIQRMTTDQKKKIVKEALKGIVSPELDRFIKTVKQKTGNVIELMSKDEFKKTVDERIQGELQREADKRAFTKEQLHDALTNLPKSQPLKDFFTKNPVLDWVKDVAKGVALAFHPALFEGKELARDAMMLIRKEKGKEARENELADIASHKMMNAWNWVPKLDKLGFILSIENFRKYGIADPKFQKVAQEYKDRMDKVWDTLSSIKDLPYIEDYFPHFWEKPEKARAHFAQVYSKKPFEGNKSFLKQRFYADILEGIQAGLKLATDNPEEMVRLAEMNALKFKTAHDIFHEMKDKGLLKFFKNGSQPEGWKLVDDPLFKRMALFTTKEGDAAMSNGGYYMPEPVARVVNNYLSRGLSGAGAVGRKVYEATRGWNNFKNLFQLGMGFFHFTTTSVDATVTGVGNAISEIMAGKPKGLIDLVGSLTVLPNIAKTLVAGHRGVLGYRTKGSMSSEVQAMTDANARTGLSKIYTLDSYYGMRKAVGRLYADKDLAAIPSLVKNTLLFLPEAISKPLMEWYVPRLKVGGYLRSLENELNLKKNLTPDQIVKTKQRVWDDMDDRLGQMVYDNLFWHKSMKDIAFMTIRSFGWSGGTVRAFGKGVGELPASAKRLVKGEGISPRTAWLLSLPVTVGMYGAMYQYLMTGKGPEEMQDYFFPKDGTMNADGTAHRVTIPSYMKDFFAYMKHPFETVAHKTAPTINEVIELFSNKDFYGTQIFNPRDPIYLKGLDILEYEGQSLIPFSFKQQAGEEPSTRQWIEQKFGIMPATKEFQRTPTQNAIITEVSKAYSDEAKTKEDTERISARREVRETLFRGNEPTQDQWDKAAYSDKTKAQVIKDATLDPYKRMFRDMKSEGQLNVWTKMTKKEKEEYTEYLNNKASFETLFEQKPELFQFDDMQKAYDEITGLTHETRGRKAQGFHAVN